MVPMKESRTQEENSHHFAIAHLLHPFVLFLSNLSLYTSPYCICPSHCCSHLSMAMPINLSFPPLCLFRLLLHLFTHSTINPSIQFFYPSALALYLSIHLLYLPILPLHLPAHPFLRSLSTSIQLKHWPSLCLWVLRCYTGMSMNRLQEWRALDYISLVSEEIAGEIISDKWEWTWTVA